MGSTKGFRDVKNTLKPTHNQAKTCAPHALPCVRIRRCTRCARTSRMQSQTCARKHARIRPSTRQGTEREREKKRNEAKTVYSRWSQLQTMAWRLLRRVCTIGRNKNAKAHIIRLCKTLAQTMKPLALA